MASLKKKCLQVRSLIWAESTWSTKRSQWKRFLDFCHLYDLDPIPASSETICLYITFLTDQVKYTTIMNYVSSIWSLHEFLGAEPLAKNSFLVRCTLTGAKRLLGNAVLTADPLLPEDLLKIYMTLDRSDPKDLLFWVCVCLAFRCLLRKCHYTSSPHCLKSSDVEFTSYGMCLVLNSSKTIQYKERVVQIPVVSATRSVLCPVFWLKTYMKRNKVSSSGPLFVLPGKVKRPYSYQVFSKRLARGVKEAGLHGQYTSHSLRRGAATFLSQLGLPLHDIRNYGDWRSLSVLLYLSNDVRSRLIKDYSVASCLNRF